MIMRNIIYQNNSVICPRLPPELWDRIIDFIAGATWDQDDTGELNPPPRWRRDLHACCLVCHTFLPRSLLQLYEVIELRSATHLTQVVRTLSNSPILRDRVRLLTINAKDSVNQSWVSLVPIRLQIRTLSNCRFLILRGTDLSTMHSHAKTALGYLKQRLWKVTLEDVHYFSSLQLVRFFRIASSVELRYPSHNKLEGREVAGLGRLPPCPIGRDRFQGEQRFFTVEMSWVALGQVTRDWDLSICHGEWDINLHILGDLQDTTGSATVLANIVKVLEHLCGQPSRKSNIRMHIAFVAALSFDIGLYQGEWFSAFVLAVSTVLNRVGVQTVTSAECKSTWD